MLNETFAVTQNLIVTFQRDGAVCLRKILLPDEVTSLRDGIDANLAHPSARAKLASEPDDPGAFIEDFCSWQENERYRSLIFDSSIGAVAGRLMKSTTVRLYTITCCPRRLALARARHGTGPALLQYRRSYEL